MDLSVFKVDAVKEVEGTWVEITFRGQTGKFKIARAGNPKFTRIYTKYRNSKRFTDPASDAAQAHDEECLNKAFAEAILIDTGEEITSGGEPIQYTPELGFELMSNPEYTELKNQIAVAAGDFDSYAVVKMGDIVKN